MYPCGFVVSLVKHTSPNTLCLSCHKHSTGLLCTHRRETTIRLPKSRKFRLTAAIVTNNWLGDVFVTQPQKSYSRLKLLSGRRSGEKAMYAPQVDRQANSLIFTLQSVHLTCCRRCQHVFKVFGLLKLKFCKTKALAKKKINKNIDFLSAFKCPARIFE